MEKIEDDLKRKQKEEIERKQSRYDDDINELNNQHRVIIYIYRKY